MHDPAQTANIENPREISFFNFKVKKILQIEVLCVKKNPVSVTKLCKKLLSIFLDFSVSPVDAKNCENDWTKLNATKQTKGRRVLKSAQIWGIRVSPSIKLDLISAI